MKIKISLTLIFVLTTMVFCQSNVAASKHKPLVLMMTSLFSFGYFQDGKVIKLTNTYRDLKIMFVDSPKATEALERYHKAKQAYDVKNAISWISIGVGTGFLIPGLITQNIPLLFTAVGFDLVGLVFTFLALGDVGPYSSALTESILQYNSESALNNFKRERNSQTHFSISMKF